MQSIQHPQDSDVVDGEPPGRVNVKTGDGQRRPSTVDDGDVTVPDDEVAGAMDALEETYDVAYNRKTRRIDPEETREKRNQEDDDMTDTEPVGDE